MALLFEIRPSPGKGQGVFATTHIPPGATVLQDRKVMRMASSSQSGAFAHATEQEVTQAFDGLGEQDQKRYLAMSAGCTSSGGRRDLESLASTNKGESIGSDHSTGPETTEHTQKLRQIYLANAFGEAREKYIFFDICRINHSCVPNAELIVSEDQVNCGDGEDMVMALKPIEKGEEVYICYNTLFYGMTREQRKAYAQRVWGFSCGCPACLDTTINAAGKTKDPKPRVEGQGISDARRVLINVLISRLQGRASEDWNRQLGLRTTSPAPEA